MDHLEKNLELLKDKNVVSAIQERMLKDLDLIKTLFANKKINKALGENDQLMEAIPEEHKQAVIDNHQFRKTLLENCKLYDLYFSLTYRISGMKDPLINELAIPPELYDSGIYLWKNGYNVVKFIAIGNF